MTDLDRHVDLMADEDSEDEDIQPSFEQLKSKQASKQCVPNFHFLMFCFSFKIKLPRLHICVVEPSMSCA